MSIGMVADAVARISGSFKGKLLAPGATGYEDARKVHNGLVDKRPALIARCRTVGDVVIAVQLARDLRLEVAVRGGGHNIAGKATTNGGVMIDLSPMKGIVVDRERRTIHAEGGTTWAEVNVATQHHGLAVTGGVVSGTGVAGLTLGGGIGWLMCKYGLALDNLLSVEMVTAAGEVLRASADEYADLFWALRGGGGNFGVATSFEFALHPVGPTVVGGIAAHPFDRASATLRFFRDSTQSLPDEQMIVAGLIHAPDGSGTKLSAMVTCHCGTQRDGETAMQPLKAFGPPIMDTLGPMPYSELNSMLDGAYPKGALNYWKSNFLCELSDEVIDIMVACFARCPTTMGQILVEHLHGKAMRIGENDTAFPHRSEGYNFLILTEWMDPRQSEECIAWARETFAAMRTYFAPGRYVNYLDHDEDGDAATAAYGSNYRRLQTIKAKYDPTNFFRLNQNIRPLP